LKRGDGLDNVPRPSQAKMIDWLPLAPRKSQLWKAPPEKKKASCATGQKKSKDGASASNSPNPNHVITPSSATISALSAEIKLSMKSSSTQVSYASSDARSADNDSEDDEASFVPNFASTMEASQQSQQSIHDWDRRFGLRRAHSKTMRESCRSRKKVLEFLKGEGSNLLLFRKSLSPRATLGLRENTSNTAVSSARSEEGQKERDVVREEDGQAEYLQHAQPDNKELDDAVKASQKSEDQADCQSERSLSIGKQRNTDGKEEESGREAQLEQLFRRASLDCVKAALPQEPITAMPSPPQEGDRRQFYARGA